MTLDDLMDFGLGEAPKGASAAPAEKSDSDERSTKAQELMQRLKAKRQAADGDGASPAPRSAGSAPTPSSEGSSRAAEVLAKARAKRAAAAESEPPAGLRKPARPRAGKPAGRAKGAKRERAASRRAREDAPKKSKLPLVIGLIVVLAAVGAGAWWFLTQEGDEPAVQESADAAAAPEGAAAASNPSAAANGAPAGSGSAPPAGEGAAPDTPITTSGPEEGAAAEPPPEPESEAAAGEASAGEAPSEGAGFTVPAPGEPLETRGITDHRLIDLKAVPLLPKWSGSSDEEWQDIEDDLALYLEDSGARSNRAGGRIVENGRASFPAIVNGLLRIDYMNPDEVRVGGTLNKLIAEIGKGTNLDWKEVELLDPSSAEYGEAVLFNKKVAATWHKLWVTKLGVDDEQWKAFSQKESERRQELRGESGDAPPEAEAPPVDPFDD